MLDGLIFDLDGTLIDNNRVHVEAWERALKAHGHKVAADRIAVEIGKGGDQLIPSILGQEAEKTEGEKLRKARAREYAKIAEVTKFPLFPGTTELLMELRRRGIKSVLATSSSNDDLKVTFQSAGVDLREYFDEVTTSDDVESSKPAPDLIAAAAGKLGMCPTQLAMIGDTPYDVESARDGGVVTLGVLGGGLNGEQTLRAAGARAVYLDPGDLLAHLDDAMRLASPGPIRLSPDVMERLMREALAAAREGMANGEIPIGCAIANGAGTVIARGYNQINRTQNRTAHAEMMTFPKAAGKTPLFTMDLILVSTLEPCVMCMGAAMQAAVDVVIYAMPAPANGGSLRVRPPLSKGTQMPRLVGNILAMESRDLFEQWLRRPGNPEQAPLVRQILEAV